MVTAYCVKCMTKKKMVTPEKITMKNGRLGTKGPCLECSTKMFTIGGK